MHADLEGESPSVNLLEVKAREAQGRHREVGSEGSVDQRYEPNDRNWIMRRQGRESQRERTKPISIKGRKGKSSGCVLKVCELALGGLQGCGAEYGSTGAVERRHIALQKSAEGIVGECPLKA